MIQAALRIKQSQGLSDYLGLPSSIRRNKSSLFSFIGERVVVRVQGWKSKFLNQVGKEVLIKSIMNAILACIMSCFLIPNKIYIFINSNSSFGGEAIFLKRK